MIRTTKTKSSQPIAKTENGDVLYYDDVADEDDYESLTRKSYALNSKIWPYELFGEKRITMFIAGNPGAGKSYLCKQLLKLKTGQPVLLFTALTEKDGNFDEVDNLFKIKMDLDLLKTLTLDNLRSRTEDGKLITLFDDVDKIPDPKVNKQTFAILQDYLANGRGHISHDGRGDVSVLATTHSLNDFLKTKYLLENSDYVALFPRSTTFSQFEKLCLKLGLDKKLIAKLKNSKERYIIIHKVFPLFIIEGNMIHLI